MLSSCDSQSVHSLVDFRGLGLLSDPKDSILGVGSERAGLEAAAGARDAAAGGRTEEKPVTRKATIVDGKIVLKKPEPQ